MKRIVVFALLSVACFNSFGQDWAKVTEKPMSEVALKVGDKIPFTELHNMVNYPKKTYKFSDHKAKLTLLDFWATNCGPCIKFWPTALKLQKEFGPDLQIIPVNNYEDRKKIKAFLAKRKRIDGFEMTLPMSCRDSTLWKNFPSNALPRYVWIDQDGIIKAITDGKDVTRENIAKWISNGTLKLTNLRERKIISVNPVTPIYVNGNGGEKSNDVFLWNSTLTKGQSDNPAISYIYHDSIYGSGITVTNNPILFLYGHAYNNRFKENEIFDFLPLGRMQLIANDTSRYFGDGTLSGDTYSYQLLSKTEKTQEELLSMMQHDLDRYFGLKVKKEKQMKKCLVFSMFDSTLATKKNSLGLEAQMRGGKIILDSIPIKLIINVMEIATAFYRDARYPIIDETGYKGLVTGIREDSYAIDPKTLDKILSKYGLHLKFEMREVEILVLTAP